MGKKIAKLVSINLMARVIVDEDATEEDILTASKIKFQNSLDNNEHSENIEFIKNDTEVPFDLSEAISIVIKEISHNYDNLPPEVNFKSLVFSSIKDLISDVTEEEFDLEWEKRI